MSKNKILYLYDPMCGWCFGFSGVVKLFKQKWQNDYGFEIISGGMVTGEREGNIGSFADYILNTIPRLENLCNITFGEPYKDALKNKSLITGSTIPSIALEVAKQLNENIAFEFSEAMQEAHFVNGLNLNLMESYQRLIEKFDFNEQEFFALMNSDDVRKKAIDGFQFCANAGVTGYPSLIFVNNNNYYLVAAGYTPLKQIEETIEKIKLLEIKE